MANWIFFVIIAQMIWGSCSVFDKFVISKGHLKNPLSYIFFNGAMNFLVFLIIPFISLEILSLRDILIALSYGIGLNIAVSLYYKAVQYDEISRIRMMELATPFLVMLTSFFILGEILSKSQLISFSLFVAAGLVVSYHNNSKGKFISKALLLILAAGVVGSFTAIASKHIYSSYGFWSAFLWLRLGQFSSMAVLFIKPVRKELKSFIFENKVSRLMGVKMLVDFSAFIIIGFAIQKGPITLISAANTTISPLVTFTLATLITIFSPSLIREEIGRKSMSIKLFAAALAIVGVLFALG